MFIYTFFKLIHHYSGICWQWFAINNTLHWNGAFVGCEILGALANNCVRGAVCKLLALAGLPIQQPATLDGGKKKPMIVGKFGANNKNTIPCLMYVQMFYKFIDTHRTIHHGHLIKSH